MKNETKENRHHYKVMEEMARNFKSTRDQSRREMYDNFAWQYLEAVCPDNGRKMAYYDHYRWCKGK